MNKLIILGITILMLSLAGCSSSTNKYDAQMAKEKYEYGMKVNAQKKVFELKCTPEEKATGKCGIFGEFTVYQSGQKYIDVDPIRPEAWEKGLDFLGKILPYGLQYAINESNNKWGYKRQQSSDALFSDMFTGMADIKGSGVTNNITDSYNDNSQTSSIVDSYKSADVSSIDSGNTISGDTNNHSGNTSTSSVSSTSSETSSENNNNDHSQTTTNNTEEITEEENP